MVQCKKCRLFISLNKDDTVKCKGGCEAVFHKKCVRKQFLQKEICDECQKNEISPLQRAAGSESSVPKISVNPSESSGEKVLEEVNKKLEFLYNMKKKLEELTETVDFYSEQYQKIIEFREESQKKTKAIEQKNIYLEKCNKALEERVQELELKEKERYIEIHGLENQDNENTKQVVQKLAQIMQLNPNEIVDAQRVGFKKPGDLKPRIVSVSLFSKHARDKWMLAKKENKITNSKLYGNDSERKIFINEDLPKYKRQLLWTVRNKLKPKGFEYIWVQNSNILVKKNNEENKIYNIKSEQELDKFDEKE